MQVTGYVAAPLSMQSGPFVSYSPCSSIALAVDGDTVGQATLVAGENVVANDGYEPQTFFYTLDTTTLAVGSHDLTAICTDGQGQLHQGDPFVINVSPPMVTVQIGSPTPGATLSGQAPISATLTPLGTTVAFLEFFADLTAIGSGTATSPSLTWDTTQVATGSHSLTAVATDSSGNTWTSPAVSVNVNNAPTIAITAPASGATLSGAVAIDVSAPNVAVAQVDYAYTHAGASLTAISSSNQLEASWSTSALPDGTYSLSVTVEDTAGNQWPAPAVLVTVSN